MAHIEWLYRLYVRLWLKIHRRLRRVGAGEYLQAMRQEVKKGS